MRYLVFFLALVGCASDAKLEGRVRELEKEVAELRAKDAEPASAEFACKQTTDVSVAPSVTLDAQVPFAITESHLDGGDEIVIREVRGTKSSFEVGEAYVVRGEYTLASADEARVAFTFRAHDANAGCTNGGGSVNVKRGSGTFELASRAPYVGDASVSLFRLHHHSVTTHDDALGSIYFGRANAKSSDVIGSAAQALGRATCKPIDISFPASTTFPETVAFELGRDDLRPGDRITIRDVRGTQKDFAKDGIYLVRGSYTLSSANEAVLGLNVTGGCTTGTERGHMRIKKGSGDFELAIKVGYAGQPHVSFYVDGAGAGGVYFGKGDFLLK